MSDDYDNYASGYSDGFGEGRQETEAELERLCQENAKLRKIVGVMREHVHEFCAARIARTPGYLDLCVLPVDHDGEHVFGEV